MRESTPITSLNWVKSLKGVYKHRKHLNEKQPPDISFPSASVRPFFHIFLKDDFLFEQEKEPAQTDQTNEGESWCLKVKLWILAWPFPGGSYVKLGAFTVCGSHNRLGSKHLQQLEVSVGPILCPSNSTSAQEKLLCCEVLTVFELNLTNSLLKSGKREMRVRNCTLLGRKTVIAAFLVRMPHLK